MNLTVAQEQKLVRKFRIGDATDCWDWLTPYGTYEKRKGYGWMMVNGTRHAAHRLVYEWLVGPIPEGLELDHLCRNRACVNPAHLEPVSHRENSLRGISPVAEAARRQTCKEGHQLVSLVDASGPRRRCRVCAKNASQRWRDERRAGYEVPRA